MADLKRCEGPGCEVDFEPKRSTARFHSATCRQRAGRERKAAESAAAADSVAKTGDAEHGLVRAVRQELLDAEALDTVAGQLALQMARRIADPEAAGISTLSKELRSLLAEAKGAAPAGPEPDPEPVEEEDEVTKARRAREEARQAAGLA